MGYAVKLDWLKEAMQVIECNLLLNKSDFPGCNSHIPKYKRNQTLRFVLTRNLIPCPPLALNIINFALLYLHCTTVGSESVGEQDNACCKNALDSTVQNVILLCSPVLHCNHLHWLCTALVYMHWVNCPTWWSLLFIFGFLCWSSIFQIPDNREI